MVVVLLFVKKACPEVGEDGNSKGPGRGGAASAGGGAAIRRRRARGVILTQRFGSRRESDGRGDPARCGNIPSNGGKGELPGHFHGVPDRNVLLEHTDREVVPGSVCRRGGRCCAKERRIIRVHCTEIVSIDTVEVLYEERVPLEKGAAFGRCPV